MNWFFHKVYWTGWISHHNKRRRGLLSSDPDTNQRRMLLGLALLGFTSVYRECFEIVIFLQNLRELYGAGVVLEGVVIGLLFTAAVGVLTFTLHQRLPYKRLLIITGVMLLFVLVVAVGEEVNEMQLAGWIGTTEISWLHIPGWMGTWLSLFNNWETFIGQFIAHCAGRRLLSRLRNTCASGGHAGRVGAPRRSHESRRGPPTRHRRAVAILAARRLVPSRCK